MRRVYLTVAAVTCFLSLFPFKALAQAGLDVSIANYQYVSEERYTLTQWYVTYTADLVNSGSTPITVTATLSSLASTVQLVPGQSTLQFPVVPAGGQATSLNTFTILVDRSVPFYFTSLQWSFQDPVANAGPNQTAAVGNTVNLTGAASTNPSGLGTLTYSWAFTSVPTGSHATLSNPTSVTPSFVIDVAGTYVVTLTAPL
jgi:PKD domain